MSKKFIYCICQCLPFFMHAQPPSLPPQPPSQMSPPAALESPLSNSLSAKEESLPSNRQNTQRINEILNFWFGLLPTPQYIPSDQLRVWFANSPESDREFRENFSQDVIKASSGEYNNWRTTPRGRLALILLLDQFPRHIYRNTPREFQTDAMAKSLVLEGLQKGDDQQLFPIERAFFYLPLEHAEDLNSQNLSVAYFEKLLKESPEAIKPQMSDFLKYAQMYHQQITRFGRFPGRNAILGRESLPEEVIFLNQWGKPFLPTPNVP